LGVKSDANSATLPSDLNTNLIEQPSWLMRP
jgi:hypothetical protein